MQVMMTYDGLVMAAVAAELKKYIVGGPVQNIRQHNDTDLTFEIRHRGKTCLLFISTHARYARIHTTASSLPVPKAPPNFCMLLRKYIKGSYITDIEQPGFDRVLQIKTEAPDGNRNILIVELMGKHSNLILTSDSGRILGAVKNVPVSVSRYRQILPGRDYSPPPGSGKANPIDVSDEEFAGLWRDGLETEPTAEDIKRWLVAAFSGIGPFLAEELAVRAGGITPDAVRSVLNALREIVISQDYAPVLITDNHGSSIYGYPMPVVQFPIENQHERYSINEVLDTVYRDLIRRDTFNTEYASLETAIKRAIVWREQTRKDLEKAVSEGRQAERYKQSGELLLASVGNIKKGMQTARLIDYYDPEMKEIDIPLDEKLTPQENVDRYFKRYRKAIDSAAVAADRIKYLESEITAIKSAQEKLKGISSVDGLRGLRQTLTDKGLLKAEPKPALPGKKEEPEFGGARIKRVISQEGYEILYGENSQSNDYLTTKVARPNDLWFHARSVTGAHVVIRTANKPDRVPAGTIKQAAEIAARNSDAKHSSLVAVDYTLRKFVRKPRSAAPGYVIYEKEKTIDVTPNLK